LEPQIIDDAAGDLVLDSQDIRGLPVDPRRPDRGIVPHPNQQRADAQLVAGAQDRAFEDVLGVQLLSCLADVPRLALEGEGRRLGAHREPLDDGEVADDLGREPVGKVVVGWIFALVLQRQNGNRDWGGFVGRPPPPSYGQNQRRPGQRDREP
jgi:hypothetical protein